MNREKRVIQVPAGHRTADVVDEGVGWSAKCECGLRAVGVRLEDVVDLRGIHIADMERERRLSEPRSPQREGE